MTDPAHSLHNPDDRQTRLTGAGDAAEAKQRRVADGRPSRAPIPVGGTIVAAARAAIRDPWRILAAAIVVSVVTALLDILADDLVDKTNLPLVFVTSLSATGAATSGDVFLSGFLCRIVGDAEHGTRASQRASIREVAADLPWRRLIGADLLVALLVIIGLAALIIPGLIMITLFAVTGPVIEIERRPVFSALRRSAGLARQHFWTVALLGTVPLVLTYLLESQVPHPDRPGAILTFIAVRCIGEAIVQAATGLLLVELCYRLRAADLQRAAAPVAGSP
jgi:hypothetical protein